MKYSQGEIKKQLLSEIENKLKERHCDKHIQDVLDYLATQSLNKIAGYHSACLYSRILAYNPLDSGQNKA